MICNCALSHASAKVGLAKTEAESDFFKLVGTAQTVVHNLFHREAEESTRDHAHNASITTMLDFFVGLFGSMILAHALHNHNLLGRLQREGDSYETRLILARACSSSSICCNDIISCFARSRGLSLDSLTERLEESLCDPCTYPCLTPEQQELLLTTDDVEQIFLSFFSNGQGNA